MQSAKVGVRCRALPLQHIPVGPRVIAVGGWQLRSSPGLGVLQGDRAPFSCSVGKGRGDALREDGRG